MSKKPISFGKISFNIQKLSSNDDKSTSGFGTFGRTPIQEQKDIEEIPDDPETRDVQRIMGIKHFGKKAKNYDVEEMIKEAKKTAIETQTKKALAQAQAEKEAENDNNDSLIGPVPPEPGPDEESDEELIGPPVPSNLKLSEKEDGKEDDSKGDDSYNELSDSDDEELSFIDRIPHKEEVSIYIFLLNF